MNSKMLAAAALIGALVSRAGALQTNTVELGYESQYDGKVTIERDAAGNMVFADEAVAPAAPLGSFWRRPARILTVSREGDSTHPTLAAALDEANVLASSQEPYWILLHEGEYEAANLELGRHVGLAAASGRATLRSSAAAPLFVLRGDNELRGLNLLGTGNADLLTLAVDAGATASIALRDCRLAGAARAPNALIRDASQTLAPALLLRDCRLENAEGGALIRRVHPSHASDSPGWIFGDCEFRWIQYADGERAIDIRGAGASASLFENCSFAFQAGSGLASGVAAEDSAVELRNCELRGEYDADCELRLAAAYGTAEIAVRGGTFHDFDSSSEDGYGYHGWADSDAAVRFASCVWGPMQRAGGPGTVEPIVEGAAAFRTAQIADGVLAVGLNDVALTPNIDLTGNALIAADHSLYLSFNGDGSAGSEAMHLGHGANTSAMTADLTIRQDGRVGIGDTTPDAKLDVAGDLVVEGAVSSIGSYGRIVGLAPYGGAGGLAFTSDGEWGSEFWFGKNTLSGWVYTLRIDTAGALNWGPGDNYASVDTKLYRAAANELKTDDNLTVALDLNVNGGNINSASANIEIDPNESGAATIFLGNQGDGDMVNFVDHGGAPSNASTPADWLKIKMNGTEFFVPLYQ